jgi:glucose-1-phosphate thymidylyltransferase
MKGIILAGGKATRLRPLTNITSKQLLPVYNKPMIFYPLNTLLQAGITEIMIIIAPDYAGQFLKLLGSGKEFGAKFTYEIQEEARGLADAFLIGKNFIDHDDVTLILGDNIFEHDFTEDIKSFKGGGRIFAKKTDEAKRFGVVEFDEQMNVITIEEKPVEPKSDYAVVGIYVYDHHVVEAAASLKPSKRGELEIVDVHNIYLKKGQLDVRLIEGMWEDAGTFDSLLRVNNFIAAREGSS